MVQFAKLRVLIRIESNNAMFRQLPPKDGNAGWLTLPFTGKALADKASV
jgi:hypothetical protein